MERPPSKWLWVALLLVFVLGGLGCCVEGCLEEEKVALLQLKPFFYRRWNPNPLNIGRPFFYALYNWVEEKSDCCKWESVECDPTTGRVIGLNLSVGLGNREAEYNGFDLWYLNASLFLPFDHLKSLYLRGSGIAGCLQNH
ncbi:putative serine-threonine protein kinase, plant-type, partial [Corchorus olitorius]